MTHHKILYETKLSFSPVSLNDTERLARLEKNLEAVIRQNDQINLLESLRERYPWEQADKAVSPATRNTMPGLRIFGLKLSTPCM